MVPAKDGGAGSSALEGEGLWMPGSVMRAVLILHVSFAGMVGAVCNNNLGICGISPVVKVMGCKFLDSKGNGYTSDAVKCLDYSLQQGVDITLNSYGGLNADSDALKVGSPLALSYLLPQPKGPRKCRSDGSAMVAVCSHLRKSSFQRSDCEFSPVMCKRMTGREGGRVTPVFSKKPLEAVSPPTLSCTADRNLPFVCSLSSLEIDP